MSIYIGEHKLTDCFFDYLLAEVTTFVDAANDSPLLDEENDSILIGAEEDKRVRIRKAYNGNVMFYQYDETAPVLTITNPTGTSSSSPTYVSSAGFTVSGTCTDEESGVEAVYVNGNLASIDGNNWTYSLTLSANTVTTISVYAEDEAGNVTETVVRYVMYDSVAPTLVVSAPTGSSSDSPTYSTSSAYTVSGTASDTGSGIDYVTVNGTKATGTTSWSMSMTLTANTTTTITVIAYDKVGRSTSAVRYVMYDSAAPSLTVTQPTSTSASSPTYTSDSTYTVSGTASDSGSGIASVTVNGYTCSGTTSWSYDLSLSGDTTTTITIVATDNAGRTTSATRYLMYDSTAPSLTVTQPTGTSSGSPTYTTSSSYTVSGTASDSGSGVASVTVNGNTCSGTTSWSYSLSLTANSTTTVTIIATDNVGRTTTVTRYVMYDSAVPTLTVTAPTSSSSSSPTYTTSSSYTVSGTASDTGSGISYVTVNGNTASGTTSWTYSVTLSANSTTTLNIIAYDNAGRTASATRYVMYDSAVPTLSVTAPTGTSSSSPTYKQSDSATSYTVSGTASDSGSGIASITVNGYTASGTTSWSYSLSSLAINTTHTITIVATDNAGRTTTATRYLRVEAYYQQAARVAGGTVQTSLINTISSSSLCQTIAGNSTAYGIMKTNYSSSMTTYIDNSSYWNVGFNYLMYKCQLKCYLIWTNNLCTLVTGSWSNMGSYSSTYSGYAVADYTSPAYISSKKSFSGYKTLGATVYIGSWNYSNSCNVKVGQSSSTSGDTNYDYYIEWNQNASVSTGTTHSSTCSISTSSYYIKLTGYGTTSYIQKIYISP